MIISPGSLFGMKLGALLGYNPMCIIVGSFLLALYMTVGSVLDEVVSQTSRYVWLVFLITAVCYAWVTGIIVIGLSVDFLFITSLAVVRLVTSLALGPMLRERMTSGHLTTLRTSFIVLNLFVLPVTAVLS
jgi:hypothetical protein